MNTSKKQGSQPSGQWKKYLSLATNKYFGLGLLVLILIVGLGYLLVDKVVMPAYARYQVSIPVPDVSELPIEEATTLLESLDLQIEVTPGRYNPEKERNIVIDQNPDANMHVKPGRRIYLTINTGATPEVTVPLLEGISLRQAKNTLFATGLKAEDSDIRPDSIPSPAKNLVTRQHPPAGTVLKEGSRVQIWYSTGLGNRYIDAPDVIGLTAGEAQRKLLQAKLRSQIFAKNHPDPESLIIKSQDPRAGTRLKEGHEIRLFVELPEEPEDQQ